MKVLNLHTYQVVDGTPENLSKYNAPHKYRVCSGLIQLGKLDAKKGELLKKEILALFRKGSTELETEIIGIINEELKGNSFLYAFPKTKRENKFFNDQLKSIIKKNFKDSIDISSCFIQKRQLNSTNVKHKIAKERLHDYYEIDIVELDNILRDNALTTLLFIDDVYSNGNTFNSMELVIKEVKPSFSTLGIVILKTS